MGLVLDGTNDSLRHDDGSATLWSWANASVSLWIKVAALPGATQTIFFVGTAGAIRPFRRIIINSSGAVAVGARSPTGGEDTSAFTANTVNVGDWNHILLTETSASNNRAIRLNNGTAATSTGTVGWNDTEFRTSIGFLDNSTGGSFFAGRVAKVGKWGVILSAGNITSLADPDIDPTTIDSANLNNYWPLNADGNDAIGTRDFTVINEASFDSGDNPGAPTSADSAGQYGYGSYGGGTYGDTFGESAAPKVGIETFTLSEAAVLTITEAKVGNETHTVTEGTTSIAGSASVVDTFTLTSEVYQLTSQLAGNDSATLAELAAAVMTESKAGNETHTMSEALALQANLDKVDSLTLTELTGSIAAAAAASDVWTLSELSSVGSLDLKVAADSWSLAEAAAMVITEDKAATDALALAEALSIAAAVAGADSEALTEAASILARLNPGGRDYSNMMLSSSGLNGYWRVGEASGTNAVDQLGSHPGTYVGAPTLGVPGAQVTDSDSAVNFPTSSDYVSVADTDLAYNFGANAFTLECWVKRDAIAPANSNAALFARGTGSFYFRFNSANRLELVREAQSVLGAATSGTVSDTTTWHHVAMTRTAAGVTTFYVDGTDVGGFTGGVLNSVASTELRIGMNLTGGAQPVRGTMDEAAIHNRALTSTEIATHWDQGRGVVGTASDSWAISETSDNQSVDLKVAVDSWTVSEVVTSLTTTDFKTASETHNLSGEVAGIAATVSANDVVALLENSAINASLLRTDAWSLTELAAATVTDFKVGSETHTLAEALGLSAQVAANDSLALSEVLASLAQTTAKVASDSLTLSDASNLVTVIALTATDNFTLSAEVAGVVQFFEAPYIHHKQPLGGIVVPNEVSGTMLLLVDANGTVVDAVTAGTVTDEVATGALV